MSGQFNITLENLHFHAFHGLYEEERKLGNEFVVNVEVRLHKVSKTITSIEDTCDYSALYAIVSNEMKNSRNLLETLAMETVEKIHTAFPQIKYISYSISKLYAPIPKFHGEVNVQFIREYD